QGLSLGAPRADGLGDGDRDLLGMAHAARRRVLEDVMAQGVPFFRPDIGSEEIQEVVSALESGWLTTGPRVKTFEEEFAKAVGAEHAIAVNSCTAALHLAVEALGLRAGEAVIVPTMTFAATAAGVP